MVRACELGITVLTALLLTVLIGAVGTEVFTFADGDLAQPVQDARWADHLCAGGWDKAKVTAAARKRLDLSGDASCFVEEAGEGRFKHTLITSSMDTATRLRTELEADFLTLQVPVRIVICTGERIEGKLRFNIDIVPAGAGKGEAARFVADGLGFTTPGSVWVVGDSGNDAAMFELEGCRGILVANAKPELIEHCRGLSGSGGRVIYQAEADCAAGVLEGVRHFMGSWKFCS